MIPRFGAWISLGGDGAILYGEVTLLIDALLAASIGPDSPEWSVVMQHVASKKCPHCHSIAEEWLLECKICFTRLDVEPGSNIPVLFFTSRPGARSSAAY